MDEYVRGSSRTDVIVYCVNEQCVYELGLGSAACIMNDGYALMRILVLPHRWQHSLVLAFVDARCYVRTRILILRLLLRGNIEIGFAHHAQVAMYEVV